MDYSGGTVTTPSIYMAYDVLNRLTNMVDAVGGTAYSYNSVGELLSENGPWANDTVSYTYENRLRTGLTLSQPSGSWSQTYGYDITRRLTNVVSPAGSFTYTYPSANFQLPSAILLPNGAYITNTFDSVARLLSTELESSTNTDLDSYAYGYNQAGQRTNVIRTAGDFVDYTYDNAGELLAAQGRESGGTGRLQEQLGYVYDAAGNLNCRTNNALIQDFAVNDLNELTTETNGGTLTVAGTTTIPATSVTVNGLAANHYADATFALGGFSLVNGTNTFTAIGEDSNGNLSTNISSCYLSTTNAYSFDLNGNLLSDGNRNFTYDDENQLIGVSVANVYSNCFVYDGKFRRRIEKDYAWESRAWVQTNETHFVYDGNAVIQERDANNNPLVTYTRGNDLSGTLQGAGGIGGLLARTDNGQEIPGSPTTAYYHEDGNGNVTMLIYANQIIAAKYLYDPFGNTLSLSGPLARLNLYRFASKEWNGGDGLYYFGRRYYDPSLQRWLNRDPIKEWGGINLFGFVGNNPIRYIDPLGLEPGYGNPVSGPNGPVGPSTPYAPGGSGQIPNINPFLPGPGQVPPGYNPTWPIGTDNRGPYIQDPNTGTKYYPHPEDARHWPHYDDSKGGRYPTKCEKPWPNQKQPPYGDQSPENPWPKAEPTPEPTPTPPVVEPTPTPEPTPTEPELPELPELPFFDI